MRTIRPALQVGKTPADDRSWQAWRDQVVADLAAVAREQLDQVRPERGEDLRQVESRVRAVLRPLGSILMQACASRAAEGLPRPRCCSRPMHRAHSRSRTMQGAVGDWQLTRIEYVCDHCGRRRVPADEFWGLGSGRCSPLMAEVVSRTGAEIPSFDRGAALLGQTWGLSLCGDTLGRTSEAVGMVAEWEQREAMALARRLLRAPTGDLAPAEDLPPHTWPSSGAPSAGAGRAPPAAPWTPPGPRGQTSPRLPTLKRSP